MSDRAKLAARDRSTIAIKGVELHLAAVFAAIDDGVLYREAKRRDLVDRDDDEDVITTLDRHAFGHVRALILRRAIPDALFALENALRDARPHRARLRRRHHHLFSDQPIMNLTLKRDALHAAIERVAKLVERRATIPILNNLHLVARHGQLVLRGTDLDMEAETAIQADVRADGAISVPAHVFGDFVRRLPSGAQATLGIEARDNGASAFVLRSGRARAELPTLPPEDFPSIAEAEPESTFAIPAPSLIAMIRKTEFAISNEQTRYMLCGLYWHVMDIEGALYLRTVATDGHRLARMQMEAPEGSEGMPAFILPSKACTEILRLAKDATDPVTIEVGTGRFSARILSKGAETRLSTKLVDATFPDYIRIIPTANQKRAKINRVPLLAAIGRCETVTEARDRAVRFDFADGGLTLTNKNADRGLVTEDIEVDYDSPPMTIGFNGAYITEILEALEADIIHVDLADPGSPTLLRAAGADDLLIVLMPLRL